MWFTNLKIYRLHRPWSITPAAMEEALSKLPLRDPGASEAQSYGWVPPRANGPLVPVVNQSMLFSLGIIQKILPASVVHQFADDKAKEIEETQGRRVGRRELRELRDAVTAELMPRAFPQRCTTHAWLDPVNGWLVINTGTTARADEFIEILLRTLNIPVAPLRTNLSPCAAMTGWIAERDAPAGFTLDQDMVLRSAENAVVRYARHSLDGDEIPEHIAAGKVVTRLAMTWADKISFVLDDKLQVKRLSFLDILKESTDGQAENEEEQFEIDFALMTGELAHLLDALVGILGGEPKPEDDLLTGMDDANATADAASGIPPQLAEDGATAPPSPGGNPLVTFYGDLDPLYKEAKDLVVKHGRASISLVQRHLRIGYHRAGCLIESMERCGVVSPADGHGKRRLLAGATA